MHVRRRLGRNLDSLYCSKSKKKKSKKSSNVLSDVGATALNVKGFVRTSCSGM